MAKKKHVDLTSLIEVPLGSAHVMLDEVALLDIQIALCHYHERVCASIADSADMRLSSSLGDLLREIQSVHDEFDRDIDSLANR